MVVLVAGFSGTGDTRPRMPRRARRAAGIARNTYKKQSPKEAQKYARKLVSEDELYPQYK